MLDCMGRCYPLHWYWYQSAIFGPQVKAGYLYFIYLHLAVLFKLNLSCLMIRSCFWWVGLLHHRYVYIISINGYLPSECSESALVNKQVCNSCNKKKKKKKKNWKQYPSLLIILARLFIKIPTAATSLALTLVCVTPYFGKVRTQPAALGEGLSHLNSF